MSETFSAGCKRNILKLFYPSAKNLSSLKDYGSGTLLDYKQHLGQIHKLILESHVYTIYLVKLWHSSMDMNCLVIQLFCLA